MKMKSFALLAASGLLATTFAYAAAPATADDAAFGAQSTQQNTLSDNIGQSVPQNTLSDNSSMQNNMQNPNTDNSQTNSTPSTDTNSSDATNSSGANSSDAGTPERDSATGDDDY